MTPSHEDETDAQAYRDALAAVLQPVPSVAAVIADRGWRLLGHETLAGFLRDGDDYGDDYDLDDVAMPVRAQLGWQLIAEGTSVADIADLLSISVELAQQWRHECNVIGMSPEDAAGIWR